MPLSEKHECRAHEIQHDTSPKEMGGLSIEHREILLGLSMILNLSAILK